MWGKKLMAAAVAGALLASLTAFPALAHGHGSHRQAPVSVSVSDTASLVCPLDGCGQTEYHTHDGCGYWGRYPVCTAEDCTETGHHVHDGHDCWGYYPVCTVAGCTETGYHTHDGHSYCGYGHEAGYCDGSCRTLSGTAGSGRGHHGGR